MENNKLLIPMSIIVAGVIVAGALVYDPSSLPAAKDPGNQVVDAEPTGEAPTIDDDVVLGEANAPVTVIEFGDFQCPYCGLLYQNVEKQLRDEYIATGKVKMVYRDFPLPGHPAAQPAGEAAACAADQGKFWAYHDELFERQDSLSTLNYVDLAVELGMDRAAFQSCVDSRKYQAEVDKDKEDGILAGVNGTPATFVNGKLISGAVPYATFKAAIEEALKNS
jgi:protein-disulfide isomerase